LGVCQWAEKIGGTDYDYAYSVAVDEFGNVYVAGYFASSTLTLNNGIALTKIGSSDVFIVKYNSTGVCQWAEKIAGTDYDYANSIAVGTFGNVYVAGYFASPSLTLNNGITLSNSGGYDGYIAKYKQPLTLTTTAIKNITASSALSGGNITSLGSSFVTVRGVCWNTTGTPTIDDAKTTQNSGPYGTGSFNAPLTNLQPNTMYYVRAYAINDEGTEYGNQISFTTIPTLPEWGLILLGGLVALAGGWFVWRKIS